MFIKFSALNLKANRMKRQRNVQHFDTFKEKQHQIYEKKNKNSIFLSCY